MYRSIRADRDRKGPFNSRSSAHSNDEKGWHVKSLLGVHLYPFSGVCIDKFNSIVITNDRNNTETSL